MALLPLLRMPSVSTSNAADKSWTGVGQVRRRQKIIVAVATILAVLLALWWRTAE